MFRQRAQNTMLGLAQ